MSREYNNQSEPERLGNSFPWVGILKGVGRMISYVALLACVLVVVLIILGVIAELLIPNDTEVIGQFG
jgi:hypothetical protein